MLARLLPRLQDSFSQQLICLTPAGAVANEIRDLGFPVHSLDISRSLPNPLAVFRLVSLIRTHRPDIVQTWLYHADLLGGLAARIAGVKTLVWNIRNNDLSRKKTKARTRWVASACARLSHQVPDCIVSCARSAVETHTQLGYAAEKFVIIPNGFDLSQFYPDASARLSVRTELGLPSGAPLIGLIGRFDPQKNHEGFIQAAHLVHQSRRDAHFLLAGRGVNAGNTALSEWISQAGLRGSVHLLGERSDIPRLNQALDVVVSSSSYGEAFPNVLGEAMACGVPVVATDAGDAALILQGTGRVVPRGDMTGLANACLAMLEMNGVEREKLGMAARQRIAECFEISMIARQYASLYSSLLTSNS